MREIKFRGVCQISKEMVFGDLITGIGSKSGNFYILPLVTNLAYVKHCDPLDGVHVLPESVGQFTGLKDRNGKEVYEFDIVQMIHPFKNRTYIGEIIFDGYRFKGKDFWFTHFDNPDDIFSQGTEYIEVIGNRFENPELLK